MLEKEFSSSTKKELDRKHMSRAKMNRIYRSLNQLAQLCENPKKMEETYKQNLLFRLNNIVDKIQEGLGKEELDIVNTTIN